MSATVAVSIGRSARPMQQPLMGAKQVASTPTSRGRERDLPCREGPGSVE